MRLATDLLYGLLALKARLIDQSDLVRVYAAQRQAPDWSLVALFEHYGLLSREARQVLDGLVRYHLQANDGDAHKAVGKLDIDAYLCAQLEQIGGDDVKETLRAGKIGTEQVQAPKRPKRKNGKNKKSESFASGLTKEPLGKYEVLHEIGRGAVGRILLVSDKDTQRNVAMKVMVPSEDAEIAPGENTDNPLLDRFIEEAQIGAQLEHPNIVPVYDVGRRADGRPYYTMKLIRGKTLSDLLFEISESRRQFAEDQQQHRLNRLRLLTIFQDICKAMGYAHDKGVVHRDLKPENIMIGNHGEVLVLDWGLAKVAGRPDLRRGRLEDQVRTLRESTGFKTIEGWALGTPAYMSPEQASGRIEDIDRRADIYSLGAILYEMLTYEPPFDAPDAYEILTQVIEGKVTPPQERAPNAEIPDGLEEICLKAMALQPKDRYQRASELLEELDLFLEGSKERERVRQLADEKLGYARQRLDRRDDLNAQIAALVPEIARAQQDILPHDPIEKKRTIWRLERRLRELRRQAGAALADAENDVIAALGLEYHNPDARAMMADLAWAKFQTAEEARDPEDMAHWASQVRTYQDGQYDVRLLGDGTVSLATDPPGAEVWCYRYVERDRQAIPMPLRLCERGVSPDAYEPPRTSQGTLLLGRDDQRDDCHIGQTPMSEHPLPMGEYLLLMKHSEHPDTRLPIVVRRNEQVDLGAIRLCPLFAPTAGFAFVPSGRYLTGGDEEAGQSAFSMADLPGFLISIFQVTCLEYLTFLNDLVKIDPDNAAAKVPREAERSGPFWPRLRTGEYAIPTREWLRTTSLSEIAQFKEFHNTQAPWEEDWPVVGISRDDAMAFAQWRGRREGVTMRLPLDAEWEKAARGADGRAFPFGNYFDYTWANGRLSYPDGPRPTAIDSFPGDESPYGVRGLGGNVADWSASGAMRGGSWFGSERVARATRSGMAVSPTNPNVGFRLVADLPIK